MSRIEAGKIELEDKPFDIRVLADELRNMFQESVEAKNLRFDVELVDLMINSRQRSSGHLSRRMQA